MPIIIPNGAGGDPLADNVVPDVGEDILVGETVLASDTKKPWRNDTAATITVTNPTAAGLLADGFTEVLEQGISNLAAYIKANGPIKEDLGAVGGTGTLTINVGAGKFTWLDETTDPDEIKETVYAAQNAISFDTYDVNGLVAAGQTIVDVENYDDSGAATALAANNDAAIWTLYADPKNADKFALLYGQINETTLAVGENNLASYTPIVPAALSDWLIVARFASRKDADNLADTSDARFRNANKFGEIAEQAVVAPMTGATNALDGEGGSVPTPTAGDQDKFLKGDATFGFAGKNRVLADETTVAPAIATQATLAEIQAFVTAQSLTDVLVIYTGTDLDTDAIIGRYLVDQAGIVTDMAGSSSAMVGATDTLDGAGGSVPKPTAGDQNKVLTGGGSFERIGMTVVGPLDSDVTSSNGDTNAFMYEMELTAARTLTVNDDVSDGDIHQPFFIWNMPTSTDAINIADSTTNGFSGDATILPGELATIYWSKDGLTAHMVKVGPSAVEKFIDEQTIAATIPTYSLDSLIHDGVYFDLQAGSADINFGSPTGLTIHNYGDVFTFVVSNNSGADKNVQFAPQYDDGHGNAILEAVADGETVSFAFVFTQTGFHLINNRDTAYLVEDEAGAKTIVASDFIRTKGRKYIRCAGAVDIDAAALTGVEAGESVSLRNVSGAAITIGDNGLTLNGNATFEDQETVTIIVLDASTVDVIGGTS